MSFILNWILRKCIHVWICGQGGDENQTVNPNCSQKRVTELGINIMA